MPLPPMQAPYVSTASGMHCQPSSEHLVSFCSCFLDSAALTVIPAETPLLKQFCMGLSGEVTNWGVKDTAALDLVVMLL